MSDDKEKRDSCSSITDKKACTQDIRGIQGNPLYHFPKTNCGAGDKIYEMTVYTLDACNSYCRSMNICVLFAYQDSTKSCAFYKKYDCAGKHFDSKWELYSHTKRVDNQDF